MWGNLPLFFTVLGTVVMVACLMVTANTMTINARERVQEVGVLKTLGFTPRTIVAMTLVEGVLLCGLAGALSMSLLRLQDGKMLMFIIASVLGSIYGGLASVSEAAALVEKNFFETLGKSGATGLMELFAWNDEPAKAITHDGEKHYRKCSLLWVGI